VGFIKKLIILVLAVLYLMMSAGCQQLINNRQDLQQNTDSLNQQGKQVSPMPIDPYEQAKEVSITLYFKHEIADFLIPEQRTVLQDKRPIEQLIVEELLKGPQHFERRLVMPPGTQVLDVTRKNDTVFVNLTEDFLNPVDLSTIPGYENIAEEDIEKAQGEMKRLAVYSIVNSLTFLDGVSQVKLMINNTQLSYREMGTELLIEEGSALSPDSPMMAVRRNKNMNLTPARTVRRVLNALTAEPDWDIIYMFLSNKTMDGSTLPPLDEFKKKITPVIGGMISFEGNNPVIEEEYLGGKAFVTVKYTEKVTGTPKEVTETLTVDELDGIWKVRLPSFFSQFK
jgi:spore germination protein GerM